MLLGLLAHVAAPWAVANDGALHWAVQGNEVAFEVAGREVARLAGPRLQTPDGTQLSTSGLHVISDEPGRSALTASFADHVRLDLTVSRSEDAASVVLTGELAAKRDQPVGTLALPLLLPISVGQAGGTWDAGTAQGGFPIAYDEATFYQGNTRTLRLTDGQGRTLRITRPPHQRGTVVVQDNRAWNWQVFECQLRLLPAEQRLEADAPYRFTLTLQSTYNPADAQPWIDAFGQYRLLDWPGKVASEAELQRDAAAQRRSLDEQLQTLARRSGRDPYGGLSGSRHKHRLEPTGYFYLTTIAGRDWLVDPDGNLFYSLGVGALTPWGTFTPIEHDRARFAWLPDRDDARFADAWITTGLGTGFSFYAANQVRKFEPDYGPHWRAMMRDRLRAWGFNTAGAFGDTVEGMPYTHWRLREAILAAGTPIPGTAYTGSGSGIVDVYAPDFPDRLDKAVAAMVVPHRDDPMLLGYFLNNEPFWHTLPDAVARLTDATPAKRQLVDALRSHYGEFAALRQDFRTDAVGWEQVTTQPLWPHTDAGREQLRAFGIAFLDRYLSLLTDTVRRHDPNHLLLGSRLLPTTADADERILAVFGKYCDIVSINYYAQTFDPERVTAWHEACGRPLLLSEWSYGAPGRGHPGGPRTVADQAARAVAYDAYMDAAKALPFVVGSHWFAYLDQAVSGRMAEGDHGERFNVGLVDVADRPYAEMVETVQRVNFAIYEPALSAGDTQEMQ